MAKDKKERKDKTRGSQGDPAHRFAEGEPRAEDPGQKTGKTRPEGILVIKGSEDKATAAMKDGGIDVIFFIEAHGNDQDTVAQALKNTLLVDLRSEKGVALREMTFHPVVEKEKLYAGFVECSFVARDPQTLMYLALRYGPSAVEVLKPDNISLSASELQGMAADLSAAIQVLVGRVLERMPQDEKDKLINRKAQV